jgi:hypothetical protein
LFENGLLVFGSWLLVLRQPLASVSPKQLPLRIGHCDDGVGSDKVPVVGKTRIGAGQLKEGDLAATKGERQPKPAWVVPKGADAQSLGHIEQGGDANLVEELDGGDI